MTFITLLTIFYIVPAVISYFGVRHQYKYEWTNISPGIWDIAMVIVPLLNWGYAIFTTLNIAVYTLDKLDKKVENSKIAKNINNSGAGKRFFKLR